MKQKPNRRKPLSGSMTKEGILEDSVLEEMYGLFLMVKDSPRHIAIKPEKLIGEVSYICNKFREDESAKDHLDDYAREIEEDMGWRYATDLVMSMAHFALTRQKRLSKRIGALAGSIERMYGSCCYWSAFHRKDSKPKSQIRERVEDYVSVVLSQLKGQFGKGVTPQIVFKVQQAEINVNCPGNQIVREQMNEYNK